ncbi:MAG: hypothetical protein HY711_03125 [Candidatus Melainabacteria bacterium]|nr:hypothetical protein [Candidatus Melainabacteria bacterium]
MPSPKSPLYVNLDERQRLRLALLLMAGLLLLGGTWIWVNSQMHQEEVALVATGSTTPSVSVPKKVQSKVIQVNGKDVDAGSGVSSAAMPAKRGKLPSALAPTELTVPTEPAGENAHKVASALPLGSEPQLPQALKKFPAASRLAAQNEARQGSGKTNPCERVEGYQPFPRTKASAEGSSGAIAIPPPPPIPKESFVSPPPPAQQGVLESVLSGEEGLSVSELPEAPAKPSISDKLKLVGVVGDKAVLACTDRMWRKENKWPKTIVLGPGEQFESLSLVEVHPDSITIEEDGERLVKRIEPLK